jgi:hypothetical protein
VRHKGKRSHGEPEHRIVCSPLHRGLPIRQRNQSRPCPWSAPPLLRSAAILSGGVLAVPGLSILGLDATEVGFVSAVAGGGAVAVDYQQCRNGNHLACVGMVAGGRASVAGILPAFGVSDLLAARLAFLFGAVAAGNDSGEWLAEELGC